MADDGLIAALARAQAKADRVHPDRRNEHMRYDYASANAVMSAAKGALSGEGLTLIPVSHSRIASDREGRSDILLRIWTLEHVSGDTRDISGEHPIKGGGRGADESVQYDIALTNSLKRTLLDLLQIPRMPADEDVEHGHRAKSAVAPKAPPRAPAKKPAKAPPREPSKPKPKPKPKRDDKPYAEWTEAQKRKYADPDEKISASTPAGFHKFVGKTLRECTNWQRVVSGLATSRKIARDNRYVATAELLRSRRKAGQTGKKLQDEEYAECLQFLREQVEATKASDRFPRLVEVYELAGQEPPTDSEDTEALLEPTKNNFVLAKRVQEIWVETTMLTEE